MMYLASLVEEMKDKVDSYQFIHTKSELDKIVVNNTASHLHISQKHKVKEGGNTLWNLNNWKPLWL